VPSAFQSVIYPLSAHIVALCDPGDQIISGGWSGARGDIIYSNAPTTNPPRQGWSVDVLTAVAVGTSPGYAYDVLVTALCADTTP